MIQALLNFCLRERLVVFIASLALIAYGWYATQACSARCDPQRGREPGHRVNRMDGALAKRHRGSDHVSLIRGAAVRAWSQKCPRQKHVRLQLCAGDLWRQCRFLLGSLARGRTADDRVRHVAGRSRAHVGARRHGAGADLLLRPRTPENTDLAELRSKQDFFVKYALQSVDGVAEVASIGGYVKQYQIDVDPDRLRYHELPLSQVIDAVRASNMDVGAKTVESSGMEFIVRGKGFVGSGKTESETIEQIEQTVVAARDGVPVRVRDLAEVQLGPAFRRGALDFNGSEAVGGVVVMRYGENPREVIQRVKAKIAALETELDGIKIRGIYDRTELIEETVATLTEALAQEIAITIAVMVLFLLHVRASLVVAITLPMAVLMAFAAMKVFGVDANIMSLAGIAIAIGTMVDMGIIVLENIYSGLADWESAGRPGDAEGRVEVIRKSAGEVIPAVLTAVTTTIVSFLPVFFLTGRDHRLFTPLAWTKTFALASSLIVAVTVVPMLCRVFLKTSRVSRWASLSAAWRWPSWLARCAFSSGGIASRKP